MVHRSNGKSIKGGTVSSGLPMYQLSSSSDVPPFIKIPLTQGKFALVDEADARFIINKKWYAARSRYTYYAYRGTRTEAGGRATMLMHRLILGLKKGEQADHINGNGLDNRRCNLRKCTRAENMRNWHKVWGSSKYKGVAWYKAYNKWEVRIKTERREVHLGYYENEKEAAKIYNEAVREWYGQFAKTNPL